MRLTSTRFFRALILASLLALLATPVFAAAITITLDSAGDVGDYTSMALNASGNPVISYHDISNGDLKVAICGDATCIPSTNTLATVDSAGYVGEYTSLALNASGNPIISYYDASNRDLKVAVCSDASCTTKILTTVDSTGDVGEYTSLALNASGNPVISYYDASNSDLELAVCTDAACTTKTLTTVDGGGHRGMHTSLALNASGNPVISYYDPDNYNLNVVVCGNAACTAKTLTIVDSTGFVGSYTSLALNASGNPVISYYDYSNYSLKVAVCGDATCTTKTLTTVDNSVDVGEYTSLALNTNGNPVISYYDSHNSNLKLAVCGDATCTTKTLTPLDSAGFDGLYSSLALNATGEPVISYYDASNSDLKVAISDSTAPRVLSQTLLDSYTGKGPISFTVAFSEDVNNPAGDTDSDDVTNPNNYWVVNKGANGFLDTVSCAAGLAGDDTKAAITSVTYSPNNAFVALAAPLPVGAYRLFICGTTSIVDLAGNPINGGADVIFNFTVRSEPGNLPEPENLPDTGFAREKFTLLPTQPKELAYSKSELTLSIPSLGVQTAIVGVPRSEQSWDVSWLGSSAGYLYDSAYPTWQGNTVLTGHVWNADNTPGIFVDLKNLRYGDTVQILTNGQTYTYEVRENRLVEPGNLTKVMKHEELSWVTLLTCESYNPDTGSYAQRRMVRAVLVSVE